jgi:hypothetical protein
MKCAGRIETSNKPTNKTAVAMEANNLVALSEVTSHTFQPVHKHETLFLKITFHVICLSLFWNSIFSVLLSQTLSCRGVKLTIHLH